MAPRSSRERRRGARYSPASGPPTTVARPELERLVKECAGLYAAAVALKDASAETREAAGHRASEACKAAIAASGLTANEFWAKYRELLAVKR